MPDPKHRQVEPGEPKPSRLGKPSAAVVWGGPGSVDELVGSKTQVVWLGYCMVGLVEMGGQVGLSMDYQNK